MTQREEAKVLHIIIKNYSERAYFYKLGEYQVKLLKRKGYSDLNQWETELLEKIKNLQTSLKSIEIQIAAYVLVKPVRNMLLFLEKVKPVPQLENDYSTYSNMWNFMFRLYTAKNPEYIINNKIMPLIESSIPSLALNMGIFSVIKDYIPQNTFHGRDLNLAPNVAGRSEKDEKGNTFYKAQEVSGLWAVNMV